MKKCRKCQTNLILGENITQRSLDNSDYICKSCNYVNTRKNKFNNPNRKEWDKKYNNSPKAKQSHKKYSTQWGCGV